MNGKEIVLDVRGMPPRERHPKIFKAWEELPIGDALRLVNDHDPKPLFYEFRAERGGEFEWTPLECGPETWSVEIKRIATAEAGKPVALSVERPAWVAKTPASVVDVREDLRVGGEPFPKIMTAAMQIQPGEVFVLLAIFEPKPLYEVLKTSGFEAWPERLAEDDWKIYLHKKRQGGCGCGGHGHG